GTPQDLYERPADLDIARFLGEANVIDGMAALGAATTPLGRIVVHATGATDGPVTVLIRPEHIRITPGATGEGTSGRVQDLHYFGHDTIMTVRPSDGTALIRVRVVGTHPLTTGDEVTVAVEGTASAWTR
ncbi:MAG TPA: TOBE domain-containing protein, partial [Micromonosporaceae bacterium]